MFNILLIDSNLEFCKSFINSICKTNNYRVSAIHNNIKEAQYSVISNYIDIVVTNANMFSEHILNKNNFSDESLLIMSKDTFLSNLSKNIISTDYISVSYDVKSIIQKVEILTYSSTENFSQYENLIKNAIYNELKKLNYRLDYTGTKYLAEAIFILFSFNEQLHNLDKDVYPIIADKFLTNIHNVKCNIRNCTELMYYECEEEKLLEYLGSNNTIKPGSKVIMYTILNNIKEKFGIKII